LPGQAASCLLRGWRTAADGQQVVVLARQLHYQGARRQPEVFGRKTPPSRRTRCRETDGGRGRLHMKLSALALDYDGTIATNGCFDPAARATIAEARRRGIVVVLVTGRRLPDLRQAAGDLT